MLSRLATPIVFFMLLALFGSQGVIGKGAKPPLKIVTLQDFKPFIWCENHLAKGIDIDIVTELFARVAHPFTIECMPWKRALTNVEIGTADALFSAYKTTEREAFATFLQHPLHTSVFNAFTHSGNPLNYQQTADLYGKRIGITSGYSVNPEFDQAKVEQKFTVSETKSTEAGIRMLLMDRIDVYINGKTVVLNKAREMNVADQIIAMAKPMHEPKPAYLIISNAANIPEKDTLISKLNLALGQMWQDGTIDKIILSYTGPIQRQGQVE